MTISLKLTWRRRIGAAALTGAALVGIGTGVANANAMNTIGFGSCYMAQQVCVPRGTLTVATSSVGGSGRDVSQVRGSWTYFGTLCNTWIDHNFYDSNGNRVLHLQGPRNPGCHTSGSQGWVWRNGHYDAPAYGKHCVTLYEQRSSTIKAWKTACNNIGG
jgi:hypothetical protein